MRSEAWPAEAAPVQPRGAWRRWWPRVRKVLGVLFVLAMLGLVAHLAHGVDWPGAWAAVKALPAGVLATGAALAIASHALYSTFDVISRRIVGHQAPVAASAGIGWVSYAFNLNLGSLVGAVALRFRLYAQHGLKPGTVTQLMAFSMLTNWLGYLVLAGAVLLLHPPKLPPGWGLADATLPWLGAALWALAAVYVAGCATARQWRFRGHELRLPGVRIAALQFAVSAANWLLIAAIVWVLLQGKVDYPSVLGALLAAAVAGVVTHVPAGLGVLEAVFVALLGSRVPQSELLGALLAYRALYYLLPLGVALPTFFVLDRK